MRNYEKELKKGCGKKFSRKHNTKCGEWFQGDQHFCNECFAKLEGFQKAKELFKKELEIRKIASNIAIMKILLKDGKKGDMENLIKKFEIKLKELLKDLEEENDTNKNAN